MKTAVAAAEEAKVGTVGGWQARKRKQSDLYRWDRDGDTHVIGAPHHPTPDTPHQPPQNQNTGGHPAVLLPLWHPEGPHPGGAQGRAPRLRGHLRTLG